MSDGEQVRQGTELFTLQSFIWGGRGEGLILFSMGILVFTLYNAGTQCVQGYLCPAAALRGWGGPLLGGGGEGMDSIMGRVDTRMGGHPPPPRPSSCTSCQGGSKLSARSYTRRHAHEKLQPKVFILPNGSLSARK
jgi:hypothetical protein